MGDSFQIWVDRLKGGQIQKIEGPFDPAFLEIEEKELRFEAPIFTKGEAYVSKEHLILHLEASTFATMPCAICNEMISLKLESKNFYHAEPLKEIANAIFNFAPFLRTALLLELPKYVECNGGKCPVRSTLAPFLQPKPNPEKKTYFPFADLH